MIIQKFCRFGLIRQAGLVFAFALAYQAAPGAAALRDSISLASDGWRFQVDRGDKGVSESWWDRNLAGTIHLPGSMMENHLGDDITTGTQWTGKINDRSWFDDSAYAPYRQPGHIKLPFWLTPTKHYVGPAWYQREIRIPNDWKNNETELFLERPHWRTDVWVDGQPRGHRDSLSVPHRYNLGKLSPGKHRLTIRIDNRLQVDVGENAHSVTDHTQTNWNGIVGTIELRSLAPISIARTRIDTDQKTGTVRLTTLLRRNGSENRSGILSATISSNSPGNDKILTRIEAPFTINTTTASIVTALKMPSPVRTWDEFHPDLYRVTVRCTTQSAGETEADGTDKQKLTFGFRDLATSGTQFVLNGRPVMMRGTLECCVFPLTGYPPTQRAPWDRIMKVVRSYGLNHIRFHSWCPPEAAFEAADDAGVYLSVECASWTNPGTDARYDRWLYAESRRILQEYGNHPSFCMMLYGNEPHGPKREEFLAKFVDYLKKKDSRRLYCGGSAYPLLPENQYQVSPIPRIQHWNGKWDIRLNEFAPETTTDYEDFITSWSVPVVSHEIGQWCVFPNLDERKEYTGLLKARNFDIFADFLEKHHMADEAHAFLMASGKLQALCYKEEIESALRTKGMGGFQLLGLHDFPGQGTALVGVLDPFWNNKGYISAKEYRHFAGPVVPLVRLSRRVFTNDEHLTASIEIANFGRSALSGVTPRWKLAEPGGETIASGEFPVHDIPLGNGIRLGSIDQPLGRMTRAAKVVLSVSIPGTDIFNSWDTWVYPAKVDTRAPDDILVAHSLDSEALTKLKAGGKVLLLPGKESIRNDPKKPVKPGFSPIFWNTAWFPKHAPTTLGILCDPSNPALAEFPTDYYTNWQWWYLVHGSPVMILDAMKPKARPVVQMIDDWNACRKLGYVFETKFEGGKLMVCSIPLDRPKKQNPVARQMLHSLLDYMESSKFDPKTVLTKEGMKQVLVWE